MCRQKGRLFTPHTWTNGIGFYINWSMELADPDNHLPLEYPQEEPSWVPEFREAIIGPIIPDKNGLLQTFTGPGLGFQINQDRLRKYGSCYRSIPSIYTGLPDLKPSCLKAFTYRLYVVLTRMNRFMLFSIS